MIVFSYFSKPGYHGDFKQDSSGNLVSIRRGYVAVHIIVNRPVLILNYNTRLPTTDSKDFANTCC